MPTLKVWTAKLVFCASTTIACTDGRAAAGAEQPIHSDGFETREPQALVIDAVNRVSAIRIAAAEYWYVNLQLPASLAVLGFDDPFSAGPASATLESGVLMLNFDGDLAGESLAFAAWLQGGALRWVCGHAPTPVDATLQSSSTSAAQTSLSEALLPEACRSDPSLATQVLDVLLGMTAARTAITEFWMVGDVLPATLAETGLPDPLPVAQARLQLDTGVLVASFVGDLDGESLGVAPWELNGTMQWVCGYADAPSGAIALASSTASDHTTIDPTLLPEWCR